MNTETGQIEQFEIENPPEQDCEENENCANQNIIFHGDVSTCDYKEDSEDLQKSYCGIKGDSELSAIINILVSAIGANCFNFSYILQDAGLVYSFTIFFFVTICIYYSIDLLRSFIVDTKYYSFALMTEKILGPQWLKLYAVSSLIIYLAMIENYENMIYSYLLGITQQILNIEVVPILIKGIFFIVGAILEICICIFTKNTKIQLLSIIALFCFSIILICIIIFSIKQNITGKVHGKFTDFYFPQQKNGFTGFLDVLSNFVTFVYAYCYQSTFPTLMGNLSIVNEVTTKKVHRISFISIFSAFFLITFFGYLYDQEVPEVLFIQSIQEMTSIDEILIVFKIILALFFFTLIPIRFMIVRDNYTTLIGKKKLTEKKEIILTSIFIILSNIFVIATNLYREERYKSEISKFLQIFGGIFGVILCFVLPVINYVSVNGKTKVKSIIGYIITGIFCVICVLSEGFSIYKFIGGFFKD